MSETELSPSKYLSDEEYDHLQRLLVKFRPMDLRNTLMLQLLCLTGARCCELLNLEVSDVFPQTGLVHIKGAKGSRDRTLPLPLEVMADLMIYVDLAKMEKREKIFNIKYNRLRGIWAIYKPVDKRIHSLRHTFAIRVYNKTKDIRLVQRAMGHKSLLTTSIYQEFNYSLEQMRAILD